MSLHDSAIVRERRIVDVNVNVFDIVYGHVYVNVNVNVADPSCRFVLAFLAFLAATRSFVHGAAKAS